MSHTIPAESLTEGAVIKVTGRVGFSHVAHVVEGKELERAIANSPARFPISVPHTSIALVDPVVLPSGPGGTMTPEESYVAEAIYTSHSGRHAGHKVFNQVNRGTRLPIVLEQQPDGSFIVSVTWLEDELWLYNAIFSFGEYVEVIEPEYIRKSMKEKIRKISEKYS